MSVDKKSLPSGFATVLLLGDCISSAGGAKMGRCRGRLVECVLIFDRLITQINLGIRIQEVYKELGGKMASYTVVRRLQSLEIRREHHAV